MMREEKSPNPLYENGFTLKRGVNISHWLSQRKVEQQPSAHYFSEMDVAFLQTCGFDHIRLPVDEPILWDDEGGKRPSEWHRLHNALGWCHRHGLRVLVDLHIVRSHYFNAGFRGEDNPLWTSEKAQDRLVELWEELSAELKDYPVNEVAYEILNEPVADDPETWNHILNRVHAGLRKAEPARKIVIGSNMWQKTKTVPQLKLPADDPDIIVSFHYYEPGTVTHYQSSWTVLGEYKGPVQYPGVGYPEEAIPGDASDGLRKWLDEGNRHYDREVILEEVRVAVEFAQAKGLAVYCGEWGCIRSAPRHVRLAWYRDVVSVFGELDVGWTIWDYKGGFRIIDPDSLQADHELIDILLERKR